MVNQMKLFDEKKRIVGLMISMTIVLVYVLVISRIWEMDVTVPPGFSGDGILGITIFKSLIKDGIRGLFFCENLGAPDISSFIDTPFIDFDLVIEVLLVSRIVRNVNAVFYVCYFLTYPLSALTMYLLAGKITDNTFYRVVISIAFAITPYHTMRAMGHITLSHYYVVPIGIYLMLLISEEEFCRIVPERYLKEKQWWKIFAMFFGCFVLGMSNIYYAFFGLLCMGMGVLYKLGRNKNVSIFLKEAVLVYVELTGVLLGVSPKIVYSVINGNNADTVVRQSLETEIYGLKIIQLLLPYGGSRLELYRNINETYTENALNINENMSATLGLIATIGFVLSCVWLISKMIRVNNEMIQVNDQRMSLIALTILTIILYSTIGGFGTVVSYFITPEIRCLNRASIVIVCLCLCTNAVFLETISKRMSEVGKRILALVLIVVQLFAIYSETSFAANNWQETAKETNKELIAFFDSIEDDVEDQAMIYQLPFMGFPENVPIYDMNDYEPAIAYLYTSSLRWSYGGIRGRNDSAEELYIDDGMSQRFVKGIMDAGFAGIYIDTKGYSDGGEAIISFYEDEIGLKPICTQDQWLYFFKLGNVKLDDRKLVEGYDTIEDFLLGVDRNINVDTISDIALNMASNRDKAYEEIYEYIEKAGKASSLISDSDYVIWLYNAILKRNPSAEEVENWVSSMEDGLSRKVVMTRFFDSQEFNDQFN